MADQGSDQGDFGYGQQDPNDSTNDFNMTAFLVRQMISRLDTMKLVKVLAVTPGDGDGDVKKAGTVDVQPLVSQIDGNGNATPHGTVYGIPWSRAQGGKNAVIIDPEVGDLGYVVVSDRDISSAKENGGEIGPAPTRRQYNLADGVYAGGALNVAPEQYLIFTEKGFRLVSKDGGSITADKDVGVTVKPGAGKPIILDGNVVVKGNLQLAGTITAEDGSLYGGNIHTSGTITGDTDVVGGGKSVKTHTHLYDRPTGPSAPAQTAPPT